MWYSVNTPGAISEVSLYNNWATNPEEYQMDGCGLHNHT